jgi:hypothetical protein
MKGFKKLFKVEPSVPGPKSGDEISLFSRLDQAEFVVDMGEEEELKGYQEIVIEPNR